MHSNTFARARRAVVSFVGATTLLAASVAQAGTVTPETGAAYGHGSGFGSIAEGPIYQLGLGYTLDNGFGGRALWLIDANPIQALFESERTFQGHFGVQLTDTIALGRQWSALIGVGAGQTKYFVSSDSSEGEHATEGTVSVGLQWRPVDNFAMALQFTHLTQSSVNASALLFQIPF